jgi:hypothetical protein
MLSEILRSRWFAAGLHAGLWLLLLLVFLGLGRRAPRFREVPSEPTAAILPLPVDRLALLFVPTNWADSAGEPAHLNLFATSYFIPPTKPTPPPTPPPPPPPTTRKVELTYQGFYRVGDGPRYALLHLGEKLVGVAAGGVVVSNLYVAEAGLQTLTLTNSAMQTNIVTLNTNSVLEVPLK